MNNSITYSLPLLIEEQLLRISEEWRADRRISRIWQHDASVWTDSDESEWLGWLDIADRELAEIEKYKALRDDADSGGFSDVLLMGMGGSSLCPEVLAKTFDRSNFHILDSTVPAQVNTVKEKLDLTKTLFIVASKSGTTLEPNCFKQYFYDELSKLTDRPGEQFIAITDPGSKMELAAREDNFRNVVFGDPRVGGRFSALSPFGMTAAAMMGIDVKVLLERAAAMAKACRSDDPAENPCAMLGLILGICYKAGRDKMTISASPKLGSFGAWMEQLIAESTGKKGKAIIPIDGEPRQPAVSYGNDRVFVNIKLAGEDDHSGLSELFASGHPVIQIEMNDVYDIGAEFFRWEFATAVGGAVMGINPFDQPDVESAKVEAKKITEEYEKTGSLPAEVAFFSADNVALFAGEDYAEQLKEMVDEPLLAEFLSAHIASVEDGDYFALLAYVEMNKENEQLLQQIRSKVLEKHLAATCLGFGPRFLHSTGQAYKGGANNGVFFQITSDDAKDVEVPGQKFTFGVVKAAQARGDFQVLVDGERRALRVHLGPDVRSGLEKLVSII